MFKITDRFDGTESVASYAPLAETPAGLICCKILNGSARLRLVLNDGVDYEGLNDYMEWDNASDVRISVVVPTEEYPAVVGQAIVDIAQWAFDGTVAKSPYAH
jgi:hypothetical protein